MAVTEKTTTKKTLYPSQRCSGPLVTDVAGILCGPLLYDKYLFTLSIILGAEIMHFALPRPQMPGMNQHLYPLNTLLSFFVALHSLRFSLSCLFLGALFGTNDTMKT